MVLLVASRGPSKRLNPPVTASCQDLWLEAPPLPWPSQSQSQGPPDPEMTPGSDSSGETQTRIQEKKDNGNTGWYKCSVIFFPAEGSVSQLSEEASSINSFFSPLCLIIKSPDVSMCFHWGSVCQTNSLSLVSLLQKDSVISTFPVHWIIHLDPMWGDSVHNRDLVKLPVWYCTV